MQDLNFLRLWDIYSPLLTDRQREITDLYFNCDLSLAEIAEQKECSRQSISDCLQRCRKQLEEYEEKLRFAQLSAENREREEQILALVKGTPLEESVAELIRK